MADSPTFVRSLGDALASRLPGQFRYLRSKQTLRRESAGGFDVIALSAATNYSPHISLAFYFGRWFPEAAQIEKRCGFHGSYYHVHQFSYNAKQMTGLTFNGPDRWEIDINVPPPSLAEEVASSIEQIAFPFFDRFATLQEAQVGHVSKDPWCIFANGAMWVQLFAVDAALGDTDHLRAWARTLHPITRRQVDEALIRLGLPPTDA